MVSALPRLPGEDYSCAGCGFSFAAIGVLDAVAMIEGIPSRVQSVALATPEPLRRARPDPATWSVIEYVCHLRDVYAVYTIRIHRTRVEDRPVLEPMLNDLRAARFRYDRRDLSCVLPELSDNIDGFLDEAARFRPGQWERIASRLPGEERTARWLIRQAAHEGSHHVRDIEAVSRRLGSSAV